MTKAFILIVTIYFPPDPVQVYKYLQPSLSTCEETGQKVLRSWEHILEGELNAEVSYTCIPVTDMDRT